jgi:hypothetical protein
MKLAMPVVPGVISKSKDSSSSSIGEGQRYAWAVAKHVKSASRSIIFSAVSTWLFLYKLGNSIEAEAVK